VEIPLPWERLLWTGSPVGQYPVRERYVLTDFRLVRLAGHEVDELLLRDIDEIQCRESRLGRLTRMSTLIVSPRDARRGSMVLRRIRRGPQLAALLEWLSCDPVEPGAALDPGALAAAIAWSPRWQTGQLTQALTGLAAVFALVFSVAIGLHGTAAPKAVYAPDDPIFPSGVKRSRGEIVRFMEDEILPWARTTLGPLKGGADRITCETCHGRRPELRGWSMPAVAALPEPDVREKGWEQYGGPMDAQMRNAIYGYLAESDKQARATYMREVVMPGMARQLHRPPYDFTQSYDYNRSHVAFGCYHCHRVN
jgi:hypothetical protein